jgi:uncharacterized SAM-binding protein YcdF (DUF218 family)
MFFYPSKLLWFVAQPTNALTLLVLFSGLLLFTRFARPAPWITLAAGLGFLIAGMSPLPYWLLRPLEDRFPKIALSGDIAGIIVLGGAIGTTRGVTSMNDAGARMTESAALALRFPDAKLVFTGGDATLIEDLDVGEARTEAEAARQFYVSLGISESRLILEDKSRNTRENAMLTKALINQKPQERWVLITSAWHMPRSVGIFRKADMAVVPYPVDFTTRGTARDYRQLNRGFSHGLKMTDNAVREWVGLVAYWLAGYTDSVLPGP